MVGENFVSLVGKVMWPNFKTVGEKNTPKFEGKLAIPTAAGKNQYLKIAAWNSIAEALKEIPGELFIKVHGHIEERSYEGKCKHCSGLDKKYWTEVVIDNFMVVEDTE